MNEHNLLSVAFPKLNDEQIAKLATELLRDVVLDPWAERALPTAQAA